MWDFLVVFSFQRFGLRFRSLWPARIAVGGLKLSRAYNEKRSLAAARLLFAILRVVPGAALGWFVSAKIQITLDVFHEQGAQNDT